MPEEPDTPSWVVLGPDDLGAVLREARAAAGWSQQQLADAAGVHRSYLSDLEQGRTTQQVQRLLRLLRTLHLDVRVTARDPHNPPQPHQHA